MMVVIFSYQAQIVLASPLYGSLFDAVAGAGGILDFEVVSPQMHAHTAETTSPSEHNLAFA
jgi:hypothetical protein